MKSIILALAHRFTYLFYLHSLLYLTCMRRSSFILISSYGLLFCLPLLSVLLGKHPDGIGQIMAYGLMSWLGLWAIFKQPRWFHIFLLPAFLAIPIEVYLRLYYNQGVSTHHIGIIAETSPKEALEFLGYKIWVLALLFFIIIIWWWQLLKITENNSLSWQHGSRWFALIFLLMIAGLCAYGYSYGVAKPTSASSTSSSVSEPASKIISSSTAKSADMSDYSPTSSSISVTPSSASASVSLGTTAIAPSPWAIQSMQDMASLFTSPPKLPSWGSVFFDDDKFGQSWPLGIYMHAIDYFIERRYLSKLSDKNKNFLFHAKQTVGSDMPQTIIMVIGESSRYDRWSVNGYQRQTNPLLQQETNLVSLSNMLTPVAATRLSVPIMTTRKNALQSLKPGFTEKSFISAFKEAGFKTFWLSNQMSFGQFDTPTSVIAKEADDVQFLNLGGFTNTSNYDDVLLTSMQKALHDSSTKKLIVLHTLGNHWNYSHRYPVEYDQWKPSLFGVEKPAYTNLKNKEALSNSYDNSILYTDYILSQVITQLKNTNLVTAMMYVSDHGQTLYDGTCKFAFHGHNTQFEFHIPALVWYSQQYQQAFPAKVTTLIDHKDAALTTENVFHSLLDMVNIRTPDEQLSRSIFSPQWQAHTRYVDSYGWSNYDDSSLKGDCQEVIDNKKPLVQEK